MLRRYATSCATHLQENGLGTSDVSQQRTALQENGTWDLWRQACSGISGATLLWPDAKAQVAEIEGGSLQPLRPLAD